MVPGSTLTYGSSFSMETARPRLLSKRPTLAAVMPLPSEEVTPPVTKTYFAIGSVLRGFFECYTQAEPWDAALLKKLHGTDRRRDDRAWRRRIGGLGGRQSACE